MEQIKVDTVNGACPDCGCERHMMKLLVVGMGMVLTAGTAVAAPHH